MISLRMLAKIGWLCAFGALTACGSVRVPHENSSPATPAAQTKPCNPSTRIRDEVRVCPGNTLTSISRKHNVTVDGIMRANNLSGDQIEVGQVLVMPPEIVHVVRPGEQALLLAEHYGVPFPDIVAANGLVSPDYPIKTGQRLAIPHGGRLLPPPPPAWTEPQQPGPVIAENPPADETVPPAASSPVSDVSDGFPVPRRRPPEPERSAEVASAGPAKPAASDTKPPAAKPPQPKSSASFLLPVQGRIVSEFGPKSDTLHNDGINIAAPRGTPIKASADGEVAYAGDGLPGFGNLILLRHADGWTSAYAHADSMTVTRGEQVQRGDTIGTVGSTGSVSEPQLHFELRKHDKAVDPKPLMSP